MAFAYLAIGLGARTLEGTVVNKNVARNHHRGNFQATMASSSSSLSSMGGSALSPISSSTDFSNISGQQEFDMILPDPSVLLSMAVVTILCIVVVTVWSQQVVPISRTKLALSKRSGPVREYLDELQGVSNNEGLLIESESQSQATMNVASTDNALTTHNNDDLPLSSKVTVLAASDLSTHTEAIPDTTPLLSEQQQQQQVNTSSQQRLLERWLFADWLRQRQTKKPGRQKEPALPILKSAKWNSGDNPILVTTLLIMAPVLVTSTLDYLSQAL